MNHESIEKLRGGSQTEEVKAQQQITTTNVPATNVPTTNVPNTNVPLGMPTASWFRSRDVGVGGMSNEIDFCIKNLLNAKLRNNRIGRFLQINGGMLLHGPPGSGKSYLARAVGKVWTKADPSLKIRFVRGPELFN